MSQIVTKGREKRLWSKTYTSHKGHNGIATESKHQKSEAGTCSRRSAAIAGVTRHCQPNYKGSAAPCTVPFSQPTNFNFLLSHPLLLSPQIQWSSSLLLTMSSSPPTRRSSSAVSSSRTCLRVRAPRLPQGKPGERLLTQALVFSAFVFTDVGESDQPIPLPNVSSSVLKKVCGFSSSRSRERREALSHHHQHHHRTPCCALCMLCALLTLRA